MADFKLTASGDLDLSTNDIQIIDGIDAIRQELQIRYRFFLGEWFLNAEEGVPYIENILKKNPSDAQVRNILTEVARTTPGVDQVQSFTADLDSATRRLTVTLDAGVVVDGQLVFVPFVVEVEV